MIGARRVDREVSQGGHLLEPSPLALIDRVSGIPILGEGGIGW